jgi:hypothetical protein
MQLTIKPGVNLQAVMSHMPAEVHDTVLLYLAGHIIQWWSLCDRPGVMFLFSANNVEAVRTLMAELPLVRHDWVDLTLSRVGPLTPLRALLQQSVPA